MPGFVRFVLAATLLIVPYPAQAGDTSRQNCGDLPTAAEQKQCAETQYRTAADELKNAYGRLLERATGADTHDSVARGSEEKGWSVAVAESQRAWEIYRDAECRGVVGRGGGSGRMVWVWGCLAEKTRERTLELNMPYDQR